MNSKESSSGSELNAANPSRPQSPTTKKFNTASGAPAKDFGTTASTAAAASELSTSRRFGMSWFIDSPN
jgi:hypothetical protein